MKIITTTPSLYYIRSKITFSKIQKIYLYTLPTAHLFYMLIYWLKIQIQTVKVRDFMFVLKLCMQTYGIFHGFWFACMYMEMEGRGENGSDEDIFLLSFYLWLFVGLIFFLLLIFYKFCSSFRLMCVFK